MAQKNNLIKYALAIKQSLDSIKNREQTPGPTYHRLLAIKQLLCNIIENSGNNVDIHVMDFLRTSRAILIYTKECGNKYLFEYNGSKDKAIAEISFINKTNEKISSQKKNEMKLLCNLKELIISFKTPHIMLPIAFFSTEEVFITVKELQQYNTLTYFLNNNDSIREWTVVIFQLLFTLAQIHHKYPGFIHGSLSCDNILAIPRYVNVPNTCRYRYSICGYNFYIPNINMQIAITNFDDATTGENNKSIDQYYDLYIFFNGLKQISMPEKIRSFIDRTMPSKILKLRYATPREIILNDPLFEKYRF